MPANLLLWLGCMAASSISVTLSGCIVGSVASGFGIVYLGSLTAFETSRSINSIKPVDPMAGAFGSAVDPPMPKHDPTKFNESTCVPANLEPAVELLFEFKCKSATLKGEWSALTPKTKDADVASLSLPGVTMAGSDLKELWILSDNMIGNLSFIF